MTIVSHHQRTHEKMEVLSSEDMLYLSQLIKERAGLNLSPEKGYLMESRLLPVVRANGLKNMVELVQALRAGNNWLGTQVIYALLTPETYFYRDPKVFEALKGQILPLLFRHQQGTTQTLRIWSCGCSSGQEPYSLAILLKEWEADSSTPKTEIIATDISAPLIDRAKQGLYSQGEVQRGLPIQELVKYFKQTGGEWQIDVSLRQRVQFQILNLLDEANPLGKFDLILCRNVLLYFDLPTKLKALNILTQALKPGGYLVIGITESLLGLTSAFKAVPEKRGIYLYTSSNI